MRLLKWQKMSVSTNKLSRFFAKHDRLDIPHGGGEMEPTDLLLSGGEYREQKSDGGNVL